jgi:hypothetical protein
MVILNSFGQNAGSLGLLIYQAEVLETKNQRHHAIGATRMPERLGYETTINVHKLSLPNHPKYGEHVGRLYFSGRLE